MFRMKKAKIKLGVFAAVFITSLALGIYLIVATTSEARQREMEWRSTAEGKASVARTLLKQNREHLDVLTQGELMEREVFTYYTTLYTRARDGWNLRFSFRQGARRGEISVHVSYDFDYSVSGTWEWLLTEEIFAFYNLIHSQPFSRITSYGPPSHSRERGLAYESGQHFSFSLCGYRLYDIFPELFPEGRPHPWSTPFIIEYNPAIPEESSIIRLRIGGPRIERTFFRNYNWYRLSYIHHLDDEYFFIISTNMQGPNTVQIGWGYFILSVWGIIILFVGTCVGIESLNNLKRVRKEKNKTKKKMSHLTGIIL